MEIRDVVYEEIKKIVDVDFDDNTLFKEDLGLDSFKALNLLMSLDNKGISFKNERLNSVKSIGELIDSLEWKKWKI